MASEEIDLDFAFDAAPEGEEKEAEGEKSESEDEETDPVKKRLLELKLRVNKAKHDNRAAALGELQREQMGGKRQQRREKAEADAAIEGEGKRRSAEEELADKENAREVDEDKVLDEALKNAGMRHLGITADESHTRYKKQKKKDQNKAPDGWGIFTADAAFQSHEKRVDRLHQKYGSELKESYEKQKQGIPVDSTLSGKKRVREELDEQQTRRDSFKRRRTKLDDGDVDFINERNRVFNEKLARNFNKYTKEIRQNLERGTALS